MNRRDFLRFTSLAGAGLLAGKHLLAATADQDLPVYGGWEEDAQLRAAFIRNNPSPFLNQLDQEIRGTGKGKTAFLWKYLEEVTGKPLVPYNQETSDCVAVAYGLGVDILTATQIRKRNSPQRWVAQSATEIIYGGGRIEIAKQKYGKQWGGGGMTGMCAAEFIKTYGILLRQKYLNGKYDYTHYSGNVANQLGRSGVPDALEPFCKLHPVGWVALVQSWEEARDSIYNSYPVILCSNQGFRTRYGRDKDGFLAPGGTWAHSMLLAGIDDEYKRPGALLINSWGDFVNGPNRWDAPKGSFWVDAAVIDRMVRQRDSIAISSYCGYPRMNYDLW